tara:strand:- start:334 stop:705 length:372 start_codon:yes stop_codon:yes gene_type:complete
MTNYKQMLEVRQILNQHGLGRIEVKVEKHLNEFDKMVPHLVAYLPDDLIVEVENEALVFSEGQSCKFEELNKYFSAKLFAMHYTQRAAYLNAPLWIKEYCYNNQIHPAQYVPGETVVGTMEDC